MKKFLVIMAAGALLFTGCTCSNSKKAEEQAALEQRIAQQKADSVAKAEAAAIKAREQAQKEAEEAEAAAKAKAAAKVTPTPKKTPVATKTNATTDAAAKAKAAEEAKAKAAAEAKAAEEAKAKAAAEAKAAADAKAAAEAKAAEEAKAKAAAEAKAAEEAKAKAAAEAKAATKPLFISLDGALNYSASEGTIPGRRTGASFHRALGVDGGLTIGSEFTPVWGWRASIACVLNNGWSSTVTRTPRFWKSHPDTGYYPFLSVEAFGDITLDFIDAFKPNNAHLWNFYAFLGAGYIRTVKFSASAAALEAATNGNNFGVRAGLNLNRKITDKFALGIEGSIVGIADQFNGQVEGIPFDMRASLGLSLIWTLGK